MSTPIVKSPSANSYSDSKRVLSFEALLPAFAASHEGHMRYLGHNVCQAVRGEPECKPLQMAKPVFMQIHTHTQHIATMCHRLARLSRIRSMLAIRILDRLSHTLPWPFSNDIPLSACCNFSQVLYTNK